MEAAGSNTEAEWRNADFGKRFVAFMIDEIIAAMGGFGIALVAGATHAVLLQWLAVVASFVWGMLYHIYPLALLGYTPGKRLMGLCVVGPDGGRDGIGWVTAIVRWLGTYLSALPFYCGYLAIAWDPERQGWHDKLAKTHVVTSRRDLGMGALAVVVFLPFALLIVGYMVVRW